MISHVRRYTKRKKKSLRKPGRHEDIVYSNGCSFYCSACAATEDTSQVRKRVALPGS